MRTAIIGIYGEKYEVEELVSHIEVLLTNLYGKKNFRPTKIQKSKRFDNFGVRIYVNIQRASKVAEFLPKTRLRLPEEARR